MLAFARAAGYETSRSEREARPYDVCRALEELLLEVEQCSGDEASIRVRKDIGEGLTEHDQAFLGVMLLNQRPDPKLGLLSIDRLLRHYASEDNSVKVRLGIAGIVERRLGKLARAEYLLEAAKGNAQ